MKRARTRAARIHRRNVHRQASLEWARMADEIATTGAAAIAAIAEARAAFKALQLELARAVAREVVRQVEALPGGWAGGGLVH
jgi:hypothetical protein